MRRSGPSGSLESWSRESIRFLSYMTAQYRHRFTRLSGSSSRVFGDMFWVSDYKFTVQRIKIIEFTSCWYTSCWFIGYWGFYLW